MQPGTEWWATPFLRPYNGSSEKGQADTDGALWVPLSWGPRAGHRKPGVGGTSDLTQWQCPQCPAGLLSTQGDCGHAHLNALGCWLAQWSLGGAAVAPLQVTNRLLVHWEGP